MVGNRVGAIIQVRYDSERLPGKALLKLPFGGEFSILEHICRRLKTANGVDEIIVATSNEKSDDAIAEEAKKIGINCFRGDKANVLDRFYKAAVSSKLQTAIRLTGDNPVIFTELFQPVISYHLDNHNDYTYSLGLPIGTAFELVSINALKKVVDNAFEASDKEHVTTYIRKNTQQFKIGNYQHHFSEDFSSYRLTVDYPNDYALLSMIMSSFSKNNFDYNTDSLLKLMRENTWLKEINLSSYQKKVFADLTEEKAEAESVLKKFGLDRIANIVKNIDSALSDLPNQ